MLIQWCRPIHFSEVIVCGTKLQNWGLYIQTSHEIVKSYRKHVLVHPGGQAREKRKAISLKQVVFDTTRCKTSVLRLTVWRPLLVKVLFAALKEKQQYTPFHRILIKFVCIQASYRSQLSDEVYFSRSMMHDGNTAQLQDSMMSSPSTGEFINL